MSTTEAAAFDATKAIETWEVTGDYTVWLWKHDVRHPGQFEKIRVGGRAGGSKRVRLTTDERRYNEEQIIEEMRAENPFRNGLLKLVSVTGAPGTKISRKDVEDVDERYHLSADEYEAMFEVRNEDLFRGAVEEIDSELVMRRLYMFGEKFATVAQLEIIRDIIETRYKGGGTQAVVREMLEEEARMGGEPLS